MQLRAHLLVLVVFLLVLLGASTAGFEQTATATIDTDDQWARFIELFGYQQDLASTTAATSTTEVATSTPTTTPSVRPPQNTPTQTTRPAPTRPAQTQTTQQTQQEEPKKENSFLKMGAELLKQLFSSLTAQSPDLGGIPEPTHEGTPFGGMIVARIECTCSGNYLIVVNDAVSMSSKNILVSPPQSRLYQYYVFNPGQQAVGTYTAGPVCMIYTGTGCTSLQTDGQINTGPGAGSSGPYEVQYANPRQAGQVSNTGNPNEIITTGGAGTVTPNRVAIDTDGINPPPFSDPDYQSQTSYLNGTIDANVHNYVVVPMNSNIPNGTPVRLTNLNTGESVTAFVADRGPNANGLGEISLNAARELGAWSDGMGNSALQHNIQWEFYFEAPKVTGVQ